MLLALPALGLTLFLCAVLSALAYYREVLTWDGSVAAFAVGLLIGILGDVTWLLLLLFFLLSSFLATRYRFALKEALGVQEGMRGERRSSNVLANGIAPMAVATVSLVAPQQFKVTAGIVFLSPPSPAGAGTPPTGTGGPPPPPH